MLRPAVMQRGRGGRLNSKCVRPHSTPAEMRLSEAGCVRREGASKGVPEAGKRLEEVAKAVGAVTVGYKRH